MLLASLIVQLCLWSGPFVEAGSVPYSDEDADVSNFILTHGCNHSEVCVTAMECSSDDNVTGTCELSSNEDGVCCPTGAATRQKRSLNHHHEHMVAEAVAEGRRKYAEKTLDIEKNRKVMTAAETPLDRFHSMIQPAHPAGADPRAQDMAAAFENVFAAQRYAELANMSMEDRRADKFARVPRMVQKSCFPPVHCNPNSKYRTITGVCNNPMPERSSWGAAEHPFDRILPPAYEDGVWAPRIHSVTGNLLPSARRVSEAVFPDAFRPDPKFNIAFMQMGQFTSHDYTRSPTITINGRSIECCTKDGTRSLTGSQRHFACMPIIVPRDDPFYSQFGVRCLNFVRIRISEEGKCKLGYAKQVDAVTHFIDASTVYGSDDEMAAELRQFRGGLLKDSFPVDIEMLPFARDRSFCVPWAKVCYEAGDIRTNQLIGLTQFHTLWMREHNRIAKVLGHLNRHWDDETIYQESRRIVIAQQEHIIYNEFLPLLLGESSARFWSLLDTAPDGGYENLYKPNVRPIAFAETAVAANRYGHSLVEGWFRILHRDARPESMFIKDFFNDPVKTLEPNSFDDDFYSFQRQPMETLDHFITTGLTDFLFAEGKPFGSDLASLNTNRQRDFAVEAYNEYRVWAGLPRITDFRQLGEIGAALASVYESPDDIDLWVGGIVEPPSPEGGVLGVTFNKLMAKNFRRLKFGDRYFYTNGPEINPGAFTLPQLKEIKRMTFAKLICANVDHKVDFYQAPEAFLRSNKHDNVPVPCPSYRPLDLSLWKE